MLVVLTLIASARGPVQADMDRGLRSVTYTARQGTVTLFLPDEMQAGDTISGVVLPDPSGKTGAEQQKNLDTLQGVVIDVAGTKSTVKDGVVKFVVPALAAGIAIDVLGANGRKAGSAEVPVSSGETAVPARVFGIPKTAQVGRPVTIAGPFDGDLSTTKATADGTTPQILAESPRESIMFTPATAGTDTKLSVTDQGKSSTGSIRFVGLQLTAPKTTLAKGERTEVQVQVTGLSGTPQPVRVQITNLTPATVNLEGGNQSTRDVGASAPSGSTQFSVGVTAKAAGEFAVQAGIVPVFDIVVPDGFKPDPTKPNLVIPDGSDRDPNKPNGPMQFDPTPLNAPQDPDDPTGPKWQERGVPYRLALDGVTAWLQRTPTESYTTNGKDYRGGAFRAQFKNTDPNCKGGKWRQIVHRQLFAGTNSDDLRPIASEDKGWKIDVTKEAEAAGKDADYPGQGDGEMLDTPASARTSAAGIKLGNGNPPTMLKATVDLYAIYLDANGNVCKIVHWTLTTTFVAATGEDLSTEDGMNHATVTSSYSDPAIVPNDSEEGKKAISEYNTALKNFTK